MRRFNIGYSLGCIALAAFTLLGCTRTENLDNLNVITKPYSLHFGDTLGGLYSTYDGEKFDLINGIGGGGAIRGLWTSGEYILLMMENNLELKVDDAGQGINNNFNGTIPAMNSNAFGPSMVINLPKYNDSGAVKKDRVYATDNTRGLVYNDSNGRDKTIWWEVGDPDIKNAPVTSFAKLLNKTVVAFSDVSRTVWIKIDLATDWKKMKGNGLPAVGVGRMYIISQKNDILAVVVNGSTADNGIYRSINSGDDFTKLPDLPNSIVDITCAAAPFGKVVIACTDSNGVWRLSGQGVWEYASFGLNNNTRIYGIVFKDNAFKNEKVGEYVFIATSDGIYRSDDLGQNWIRLEVPGMNSRFTAIY